MTDPSPELDADLVRLGSAPTLGAAAVGALVLLLAWPLGRLLRRRRRA